MDIINKFNEVLSIDIKSFIYILPLLIGLIVFLAIMRAIYLEKKVQKTFTVRKKNLDYLKKLNEWLSNNKKMEKLLDYIAKKLCMFNDYTFQKNKTYAVFILLAYVGLIIGTLIYMVIQQYIWYLTLIYLGVITCFLTILLLMLIFFARTSFNKELPDTFRILNSRFITNTTVMQAIDMSIDDFNGSVQREMRRIYGALRKNDPNEINKTFKILESNYNNNYFTILLMLIQKAHYKGGKDEIKDLFADVAEELLIELEHNKDITYTTRLYIVFSFITTIVFIWGSERFNIIALGDYANDFFNSSLGVTMKLCIIMAELLFIVLLLLFERISS